MFARSVFVAAMLLALSRPALALTFEKEVTPRGDRFILVSGEFRVTDNVADFAKAVASHDAGFVTFNSPGGNISSAMALGRMIRALALNTFQIRAGRCESACALAFVGGVNRMADPGSIGVHRTYFESSSPMTKDEAVAAIQASTAEVIDYLVEMGVDSRLLAISLRFDREDMRHLSGSEMTTLRVTTDSRADSSSAAQPENEPHDPEEAAAALVISTIHQHQLENSIALKQIATTYAKYVNYFGKSIPVSAVLSDKADYFNRWPHRIYHVDTSTMQVFCEQSEICSVSGSYAWSVRNDWRLKRSSGKATFAYKVDLGRRLILAEGGEVTRRD